MINASSGSVLLRVGDDLRTHQNSLIRATNAIDVYGDYSNADLNYGSTMVFRGDITSGYLTNGANSPPVWLTTIFGNSDLDTIQFGDRAARRVAPPSAAPATSTSARRRAPSAAPSPPSSRSTAPKLSTGDDGEDRFFVYYLQSMAVGSGQVGQPAGAGHTLTLDGQADSDTYTVQTTGSRGSVRNYVINILDTGARQRRRRRGASSYGRRRPPTTSSCCGPRAASTPRAPTASNRRRRPASAPTESARPPRLRRPPARHGRPVPAARTSPGNETTAVQRDQLRHRAERRLDVFGYGGNDRSTSTTPP